MPQEAITSKTNKLPSPELARWYKLIPHPVQLSLVNDDVRFKVVPAGRRSGKTERAKRFQPLVYEAFVDPQHATFGDEGLRIDAESIFLTFCASCHGAAGDGSGLPGIARDFRTATEWKRSPKAVDIFRTLTEGVAETQMRAYPNISPWERVALAHHVHAFMTDPGPDATAEDYAALVEEYELDKIQPPGKTISVEQAMEILSREGTGSDEI